MSKITPGEWIVQEWEHKDNDGSLVTCGYQVVARQAERDVMISACTIEDEDCSDLHLIAAAPELLAALEAAIECGMVPTSSAKEGGAMHYVRQAHVADQIRAAIAKAKGV